MTLATGFLAAVTVVGVPNGGIQPQAAVGGKGAIHLVYQQGDPRHSDVFYVRSTDGGTTFSSPVRVNSQPGSAIATGTIRGAQVALGANGRIHVAWNGAGHPAPMLYTRSTDGGASFEPQRNLMQHTAGLDGGGTVTADASGNVYVAWHGKAAGAPEGEAGRRVWIARSTDGGKTFTREAPAFETPTGACACCGMQVFTDSKGRVYALYRSAIENVNRDIYLLTSTDQGRSFQGKMIHPWQINACPMSSMAFAEGPNGVIAAWETQGQVYFATIDPKTFQISTPIAAPGEGKGRKHPVVAVNRRGETTLVWTEGTGWQRGGSFAWQVFDWRGQPTGEKGSAPGIPVWSFAAVFPRSDGGFTIVR